MSLLLNRRHCSAHKPATIPKPLSPRLLDAPADGEPEELEVCAAKNHGLPRRTVSLTRTGHRLPTTTQRPFDRKL